MGMLMGAGGVCEQRGTGLPDYPSPIQEVGGLRTLFLTLVLSMDLLKGEKNVSYFLGMCLEDSSLRNIDFRNKSLTL